jgi:hypothetical protein
MSRPVAALLALSLLLFGCGRPTPPVDAPQTAPPPAGSYAITVSGLIPPFVGVNEAASQPPTATPTASVASILGEAITLAPSGQQSVMRIDNTIYVSVEFLATNATKAPLERVALLGIAVLGARGGSALSAVRLSNGQAASERFTASIHPTHALRLVEEASGRRLIGRQGASDFVAIAERELPHLPAGSAATTLFPYGFWIGGGSRLEPGASARVTLAFTFPVGAQPSTSLERFTWHAVLVQLPELRSVQAPEERHTSGWLATTSRASSMGGASIVALGSGERAQPRGARCSDLIALANVRIAGVNAADPNHRNLLPATIGQPATFTGCPGENP